MSDRDIIERLYPPGWENAHRGVCIAQAMGGTHCVGRCQDPKDCSAKPLPLCAENERLRGAMQHVPQSIEKMMGDLVDRLATEPEAKIDPRAWRQLLIYAPRKGRA